MIKGLGLKMHLQLLLIILFSIACSPSRLPAESQQLGLENSGVPDAVREILNSCKTTDQENGNRFLAGLATAVGFNGTAFRPASATELSLFLNAKNPDDWQAKLGNRGGADSKAHELVESLRRQILSNQNPGFSIDEADIRKIATTSNLNATHPSLQSNQARPIAYSGPKEISRCESAYALTSLANSIAATEPIERPQLNMSGGYDPNFCLLRTTLLIGFTCALAAFGAAGGG